MPSVDIAQIEHVGVLQAMVMEKDAEIAELREALRELHEAESAMFPAAECGREAQDAWCERRALAREQARAAIAKATK